MGNRLYGMPMDPEMWVGMAAILLGVPAAIYGAMPLFQLNLLMRQPARDRFDDAR